MYAYGKQPRSAATAAPAAAAQGSTSTNPACLGCDPPLNYQPGNPVMGGSSGTVGQVTITPIYWVPTGFIPTASLPAWTSFKTIINQYLTDVAKASGTSGNDFAVNTEYYQDLGLGAGRQSINYKVIAGAEVDDPNPYPANDPTGASGCQPQAIPTVPLAACVADPDIQTEVQSFISTQHPADDSHLYMVFFPPTVETCAVDGVPDQFNGDTVPCSGNAYCGYHNVFGTTSNPVIYANMPYPVFDPSFTYAYCGDPYNGPEAPNGNSFADALISVVSHEASESITDYDLASWFDATGNEEADECAYVFGTPLGSSNVAVDANAAGTAYNQVINGDEYYTQDEFSNVAYSIGVGDVNTPTETTDGSGNPLSPIQVAGCVQQPNGYRAVTPFRLFDTRDGTGGVPKHTVGAGQTISVQVRGVTHGGVTIPAAATAVALNVTGVNATAATVVRVWPDGAPVPTASTLNLSNGNPVPNFDIVAIGADGKIAVRNNAGTVNVLADVAGYYTLAPNYVPLTPFRLFDTRDGTGGVPKHTVGAGQTISVQVRGVTHGGETIPAVATSVALNVTGVDATAATVVRLWPDGAPVPTASTLNLSNSHPVPNFDVVAIGADGKIAVKNNAGTVNVLADVAGYYTPLLGYVPLAPFRLFDTRDGTGGVPIQTVGAGQTISVQVQGVTHGLQKIPADATAVALNVTGVNATAATVVRVWPDGAAVPTASTLNLSNGNPVPNFDVVAIGADGKIALKNNAGNVNLLADVAGYYPP
jgi:hypothetical protein